jgi:phenylacetate-CoA ligase
MIYVDRVDNLDNMEIDVEMTDQFFSDEVRKIEELNRSLAADIYSSLGVSAKIRLVEPKSIQRSEGRPWRVVDKRKIF